MKPQVEALECRANPSTVTLANGVITVTGDQANNDCTVTVTDVGLPAPKVIVDIDVVHREYALADVTAIAVTLNGGGDWFTYANNASDENNDYTPVDDSALTVTVNGSGGDDGVVILGGSARYVIAGNSGDDIIDCSGTTGGCTVKGGAGDDWIDGSDYDDQLYGNDGNDTLWGWDGADTIDGGAGTNRVYAREYLGTTDVDVIYKHATDTVFSDPEDTIILV